MKKILEKTSVKDALAIVIMIASYNFCTLIAYDTFQYLNIRKIIWAIIGGFFYFVPMYAVLWITLRKMQSKFLFLIVSFAIWVVEPILISQMASNSFNAWQGENQIFEAGKLTLYGYFSWLLTPFLFLTLYAMAIFMASLYMKLQSKNERA